jgi:hypothetical protein
MALSSFDGSVWGTLTGSIVIPVSETVRWQPSLGIERSYVRIMSYEHQVCLFKRSLKNKNNDDDYTQGLYCLCSASNPVRAKPRERVQMKLTIGVKSYLQT